MSKKYSAKDEPEWSARFGHNLEALLEKRDMSKTEFARALGITNAMVSRYIHGDTMPSFRRACEIADVLRCEIDDLVSE